MYLIENIDLIVIADSALIDGGKQKTEAKKRVNQLLLRFYDHILAKWKDQTSPISDQKSFEDRQ